MTLGLPKLSLLVSALCLLIAVVIGAYRHWCIYLWKRTATLLMTTGEGNKTEEFRLGAYIPAWKSRRVRIGSWLAVAACSLLGATCGAILLKRPGLMHGGRAFLAILFARWVLSALLGARLAVYTQKKAEGLQPAPTAEYTRETLEFCGLADPGIRDQRGRITL